MPRDPGREGLVATAEHHQPRSRARTNCALRSLARASRDAAPRTRALLRSPARAAPGSRARARTRGLPCAAPPFATCRMGRRQQLQRGVGGGGGEGEAALGLGEGPRRAGGEGAGKRGQAPRAGRPGGQSGWAPRSARVPPPPPTPFCKAISAILLLPSRDSWQERIQRLVGVFVLFYFNPLCVVPFPEPPDSGKNSPCCPLPRFLSQPHCQAFV